MARAATTDERLMVELSDEQVRVCLAALRLYAEDRRKVARRRDRREGNPGIERAMSGTFALIDETALAIRRAVWAKHNDGGGEGQDA